MSVKKRKKRSYTREEYEEAMRLLRQGFGVMQVSKWLNIPLWTLYHWRKGEQKPYAAKWEPKPSPELAYVLGALLGDGSVGRAEHGAYRIKLSAKDYEFVEQFSKCLATVLGKPEKTPKPKRKGTMWYVKYYSKAFAEWYTSLRQSLLQGNTDDLSKYVEHNVECVRAFLRGIFDAEGGHHYNKTYDIYSIRLYNTDLALLRYVQYLLSRYFSIPSHLYLSGQACNNRKPRYKIEIYRRPLVERFLEMVGFTITRKQFGLAVRRK